MRLLFYDFEVFKHFWNVVIIDYETKEKIIIIQNMVQLEEFYNENKDSIWIGYNSRQFDQYVLKGLLIGKDPFDITTKLIVNGEKGYHIIPNADEITLINFDIATGFHSLKQLEGFMGSRIKETSVPFDLDRKLTEQEVQEVIDYCIHDVEETIKVFDARREEFDSQLSLIKAFDLEMNMFNKTKAQLSAHVLGANTRGKFDDEFELILPNTLILEKYTHVLDWYKDKSNLNYKKSLVTDVCGVPHVFAWGGIHGAKVSYVDDGDFIMSDIASMYPALMIEYNLLSRNVENPAKFKEIRDNRIVLKKAKDPMQLPMKIVLNSTYGASKDKHNNLYDPRMANSVCVAGQLLLLDLIEKVEPYCTLIQSNTDGILVKVDSEYNKQKYLEMCEVWSARTRLDLEHDSYVKVIQKDVNNYIIVDSKGKYKSKGAYVKSLSKIDNDLPIVNKAVLDYFIHGTPTSVTINDCNNLMQFQKIVKLSGLYSHVVHGDKIIKEKVNRVFASLDESDVGIFKVKIVDDEEKLEKISYTPEKAFIFNDDVTINTEIPSKLDKNYYIEMANQRVNDFLTKDIKIPKEMSDIATVSADLKSDVLYYLEENNSSFLEFIEELFFVTEITNAKFEIFVKLNYFKKFGKPNYLLKVFNIYNTFKDSKVISKVKYPQLEYKIRSCSNKETEKQFRDIDNSKLISMLIEDLDVSDEFTIKQLIGFQFEFSGNVRMDIDKRYHIIKSIDSKYTPKIECQSLGNGESFTAKVNKKIWDKSLKVGDIIYIQRRSEEFAWRKTDDGFDRDETRKEWHIKGYTVVSEWELEEEIYG